MHRSRYIVGSKPVNDSPTLPKTWVAPTWHGDQESWKSRKRKFRSAEPKIYTAEGKTDDRNHGLCIGVCIGFCGGSDEQNVGELKECQFANSPSLIIAKIICFLRVRIRMTMHDALWVYDRPGLRNISPHRVAVLSREQRQVFRIYSTYIVLFAVPSNLG